MREFRFRLERILSIRRHKTKEAEIELARVDGECLQLERRIQELQEERRAVYHGGLGADLEFRVAQAAYIERLGAALEESGRRLDERAAERERLRESYRELAREEQVLDKLRERRADEHYRAERADELSEMNEIGVNITARRNKNRGTPPK